MVLLVLLSLFELISMSIYLIMDVSNTFKFVIEDYEYRKEHNDLNITLFMMALFGGWFLAPYFIYLAYEYFKFTRK